MVFLPLASTGVGVSSFRLFILVPLHFHYLVFYIVAIVVIPFSILSFIFLPDSSISATNMRRKLDWQGVVALAGGLIFFVYAVSEGNDAGSFLSHIF